MTQRVSVYSGFTAKLKSGPRRQFGPRRSPERFWCFHRVIGPIQLYGNTDFHLGRSWVKTGYVAHGHFCCIHRYTRTRVASRPSRAIQLYSAIQRYTALYIIQLYIAIHYTTSTTPLWGRRHVGHGAAGTRGQRDGGSWGGPSTPADATDWGVAGWTCIGVSVIFQILCHV